MRSLVAFVILLIAWAAAGVCEDAGALECGTYPLTVEPLAEPAWCPISSRRPGTEGPYHARLEWFAGPVWKQPVGVYIESSGGGPALAVQLRADLDGDSDPGNDPVLPGRVSSGPMWPDAPTFVFDRLPVTEYVPRLAVTAEGGRMGRWLYAFVESCPQAMVRVGTQLLRCGVIGVPFARQPRFWLDSDADCVCDLSEIVPMQGLQSVVGVGGELREITIAQDLQNLTVTDYQGDVGFIDLRVTTGHGAGGPVCLVYLPRGGTDLLKPICHVRPAARIEAPPCRYKTFFYYRDMGNGRLMGSHRTEPFEVRVGEASRVACGGTVHAKLGLSRRGPRDFQATVSLGFGDGQGPSELEPQDGWVATVSVLGPGATPAGEQPMWRRGYSAAWWGDLRVPGRQEGAFLFKAVVDLGEGYGELVATKELIIRNPTEDAEAGLRSALLKLRNAIRLFQDRTGCYPAKLTDLLLPTDRPPTEGIMPDGSPIAIDPARWVGPCFKEPAFLPSDPIRSGNDWRYTTYPPDVGQVHSYAEGTALDGTPYATW